jgi:flagellar secretion chaperone FliS
MTTFDPWNSYRQVATKTAPPGQIVLMLYDGAIRFLERSLLGFECEDPAEFHQTIHNNIRRTQDIIDELELALNTEKGGDLAQSLQQLYQYMQSRLHESNRTKTETGIRDTLRRLSILREAWAQMLRSGDAAQAHDQPIAFARG